MAKRKEEKELNKIKNTLVKLNCGKCGATRNTTYPDPNSGVGGTRCNSCNTFDDFYTEYTHNGDHYSWVTVYNYYNEDDSPKNVMKSTFILKCNNAKQIYNFFKENKYTFSEINNVVSKLGINYSTLKEYYPQTSSEEEINKQKKNEEKLTRHLKKLIKS